MTRPTARVLALLEVLQTGGTHTVATLAGRLGVDERTVRRYVEHLQDLDVPVRSVRGRYGGYHLAPGFRMPPLMLTDAEALATLVGLVAGQRAGVVPDAADSAAAKVRRVLPRALADRLDALLGTVELTLPERAGVSPETGVLLTVAEAARDHRPVEIRYAGRGVRTLHPYGLVAHGGRWYATGADSASGEVRTFRLDRIGRATIVPGTFEVPPDLDPTDRLLTGLAGLPRRHEVRVRVQAPAPVVRKSVPAGLAVLEELPDDWVRVTMQVESLDWVPGVLAGLGAPFEVEAPDELRGRIRDLADRLRRAADAPATGPGRPSAARP
ncbi:helix-turn-helix transcriptional regulator [Actinomycetospora termitidis]|uniref:YafY family protein n=1 Tax=Actinomycetospora termitidis TaxID=3053470 RepID=A0ABT7M3Y4_9PSEU|nr:YafY family protein [Actinomycetospora sp. Odt1-22]MDL5155141.1 YafY family protein [Actinomycetospora sp. Odt1-22]